MFRAFLHDDDDVVAPAGAAPAPLPPVLAPPIVAPGRGVGRGRGGGRGGGGALRGGRGRGHVLGGRALGRGRARAIHGRGRGYVQPQLTRARISRGVQRSLGKRLRSRLGAVIGSFSRSVASASFGVRPPDKDAGCQRSVELYHDGVAIAYDRRSTNTRDV
jgi:hypothetical protein